MDFWEYFLEDAHFNSILTRTAVLPPPNVDFNVINIFIQREGIIRACFYYKETHTDLRFKALDEAYKILYIGVLEYAGYMKRTTVLYPDNVTFLEHSMLGLTFE